MLHPKPIKLSKESSLEYISYNSTLYILSVYLQLPPLGNSMNAPYSWRFKITSFI